MLDALRRGATGLVAKLLLGLLIASFAVWGIADVFQGFGRGTLATVGEEDITPQQFERVLRTDLDALSQEIGRRVTFEDARREGYDRLVLSKLIGQAALAQDARDMKLGLSLDDAVADLKADPDFKGADGKFAHVEFQNFLSRLGLSESQFMKLRIEDQLRKQISGAILAATAAPQAFIDVRNKWDNESRSIRFFKIDAAKVAPVAEPDEATLKTFYEGRKAEFMSPELRRFAALVTSVEDLKKEVEISEEELKAAYTDEKDTYDKPERRRIQQIAFKGRAAAEAAREALVKGSKNFLDVAKENGAKESDINLGMKAKKELIDPKVAEAAFKLERDAYSEVIDGLFATVIVRVIEIEPGLESTFEGSREEVREKLATKKAGELIQERADLVEEARNAGKTLKEIADSLKLRIFEVSGSDRDNKTADGKTAVDSEDAADIIEAVFKAQPGVPSEAIELGKDGYAWIDVISADPPKEKPFDQVKDAVMTAWRESEQRRLVKEAADKLVERVKAGEDIATIATEAGGTTETVEDIRRTVSPPGLTQEAVELAFTLPLNGAASALTADRGTRTVMKVIKITPAADPTATEKDKIVSEMRRNLQNDMLIAYVTDLQERLGVKINEAEFRRVTGADVAN